MKIVSISGEIGWSVSARDIRAQLKDAKGKSIRVEINTPGGSVFQGIEIFNLLRDYKGKVITRNMSMAGSMGSYIMLAGDEREAYDNSTYFVHYTSGGVFGNRFEHEKMSKTLSGLDNMLVNKYVEKTGKSKDEIEAFLKEETYFFGNEILDNGFVDRIIKSEDGETDKETAVAVAQAAFHALGDKATVQNLSDDYDKIAALLPEAGPGAHQTGTLKPAATGANKNKPEVKMNLDELLATDEDAKKEYQARLEAAKTEAAEPDVSDKATDTKPGEKQNDMTRVLNVIESDTYPKAVRDVAIKVLKNEVTIETFESALVMYDMLKESKKSDEAADEQPADTPAGKGVELSTDGKVETEADEKALIAKLAGGK